MAASLTNDPILFPTENRTIEDFARGDDMLEQVHDRLLASVLRTEAMSKLSWRATPTPKAKRIQPGPKPDCQKIARQVLRA
jgi:hypothetical protein